MDNSDINKKYEMLLYRRKNRNYEQSNETWKPLINPNDNMNIKKYSGSEIKKKYEDLLTERQNEIEINNNKLINIDSLINSIKNY
jgi:hypothetical protein